MRLVQEPTGRVLPKLASQHPRRELGKRPEPRIGPVQRSWRGAEAGSSGGALGVSALGGHRLPAAAGARGLPGAGPPTPALAYEGLGSYRDLSTLQLRCPCRKHAATQVHDTGHIGSGWADPGYPAA